MIVSCREIHMGIYRVIQPKDKYGILVEYEYERYNHAGYYYQSAVYNDIKRGDVFFLQEIKRWSL